MRFWLNHYNQAWTYSSGSGVTVGLVDTGIDQLQQELIANFNSGMSTGRTITTTHTNAAPTAPYWRDTCGHGTRMGGIIAAPRNGQSMVGVAWGANLFSVRVDNDVFLTNVEDTRLGIRSAAQNSRVVAMAFGTYFTYSSIIDELSNWYYNYDKLFIAAAGTSLCNDGVGGVTFPGTLNTLVTTVTRLEQSGAIGCDSHYGTAVDFAAYGGQITTGWGGSVSGMAGSSNATGIIAAVAALMWSRRPTLTRQQVLSDLIYAASPTGLLRDDIGWGVPNALCAIRELCRAWVDGPSLIEQTGLYTFTARQAQSSAPIAYQWSTGETTATIQRQVDITYATQEYTMALTVTITDLSSGRQKTVTKYVTVRQPFGGCPTCV